MLKLEPTNMKLVDEPQKDSIVKKFLSIYANDKITITSVKEKVDGGKYVTYGIYTDAEDYIPVDRIKADFNLPKVIREYSKVLVVEGEVEGNIDAHIPIDNNRVVRITKKALGTVEKNVTGFQYAANLVVYNLPSIVEAGACLDNTLGFDVATIKVEKIDVPEHILARYEKIADLGITQHNRESLKKKETINVIRDGLQRQISWLHKWTVVYTFYAPTLKDLEVKVKEFKKKMSILRISVDWPSYVQKSLYESRRARAGTHLLYSDTFTLGTFYPFLSMEMLETGTNAVFLGINKHTGSPIYYNRDNRQLNYHIVIVGASGVGKSMFTKVKLYRLYKKLAKQINPAIVIIDPSNIKEYKVLAEAIGIEYREMKDGIGIDPLRYDAAIATNILSRLFRLNKVQEDKLVRVIETIKARSGGIDQLETEVNNDGDQDFCNAIHHGMVEYGYIFKGTFTPGSFAVSTFSHDNNAILAASTLVMLRTKEYFNELDLSIPKFLVVDEGWKIIEDKYASETLATISREGRKSNISLVFITQDPKDILENRIGATILNNCDTKILMPTDASHELKQVLSLSNIEENILKTTVGKREPGEFLGIFSHKHVYGRVIPTAEELKMFTTKAV